MTSKKVTGVSLSTRMHWCIGLAVLYIALIFILPYSSSVVRSYHLSNVQFSIVELMVNVPVIAVWFFSFWGYTKLLQYCAVIKKSKEGPQFEKLAHGSVWLAWSLPITAIISRILGSIADTHKGFRNADIIIYNYIYLLLPLIAFIIIGSAARGISGNTRVYGKISKTPLIVTLFALLGILYCFLVLRSFDSNSLTSTNNSYALPVWLMVTTVMLPYLYSWFIGLLAAYEINSYAINVKGILYKKALQILAIGLFAIVFSFIASQYIRIVWPSPNHLIFNYRLIITTLFKILGGIGFILMATGANRLKRIEEI